jgi:UDP-N-acetylmuramate dehydrogenase
MAPHTSLGVGGEADAYLAAENVSQLTDAMGYARELEIPVTVIGRGTNLLVSDQGVRGLVIENRMDELKAEMKGNRIQLLVDAGFDLTRLARRCIDEGWSGLEWAAGIPGSIGGALANNAGAFGSCMADIVGECYVLEGPDRKRWIDASELSLGYRTSLFRSSDMTLLRAGLHLEPGDRAELAERAADYLDRRRRSQPKKPSAGSTFKNPRGDFAGRLIEAAGLKGWSSGGACISDLHANFVVNDGGATAWDVWRVIRHARQSVLKDFGILLQLEIELVGDWPREVLEEAYG